MLLLNVAVDESHKHLGITPAEWHRFIDIAEATFEKSHVPVGARRALLEILHGFEHQCVLTPGDTAPPDPGAPVPHPSSMGSGYHRLGGVYPIAHFADVLVERLIAVGSAVTVPVDNIDEKAAQRHPPGLKYLLTELLCHATGGPEVVTAKGFDDAKLGVAVSEWAAFSAIATEVAASVFPTQHHRAMILSTLGDLKAELCHGIVESDDTTSSPNRRARQKLEKAGFDGIEALAALSTTDGDADKALEKLMSGWTPDKALSRAAEEEMAQANTAAAAAPKCPFGFGGGKAAAVAPPLPPDSKSAG